MENSEPKSSRERFLEEQQAFKIHNDAMKNPDLSVSDEEVDELENELQKIDKNMGTEGFTITKQEYEADKLRKNNELAVEKMQSFSSNTKLSNDQREKLQKVISNRNNITDPVLKHLVLQKALQEQNFNDLKKRVKDINERIMKELMQASNDLLKTQGAIENIEDQILKYVELEQSSV